MSINPSPPVDPATLTITQYQQLAAEFSADLDNVLGKLPKREAPRPVTKQFVRARTNVPVEFLGTAIAGVEAHPRLQGTQTLDVNVGRDTLQFNDAFRPIVDKMARLQKELKYALNTRLAVLTEDALQIYEMVQTFARDETNTPMVELAADLKRDLGRAETLRKNAAKKTAAKKTAPEKNVAGKPAEPEPAADAE